MRRKALVWVGSVTLGVLVAAGHLGIRWRCAEANGPLPIAELAAERYRFVNSPGRLPWAVQRAFARTQGGSLHMAAVGKSFNTSDVVVHETLPWSRLIVAAVGPRYAIVQVETGGHGPGWYTSVFRDDGWSGWVSWTAHVARKYRDEGEFAAAVRTGDLWRAAEQRDAADERRSR
jgi:hypothetical protein